MYLFLEETHGEVYHAGLANHEKVLKVEIIIQEEFFKGSVELQKVRIVVVGECH